MELGAPLPCVRALTNDCPRLVSAQGNFGDAKPLCERSLAILEKALGPDHPHVATALHNLAGLLKIQVGVGVIGGRFMGAGRLFM